uniref:RNA helicase n=1 Tax=Anopheles atroparvus TaxID=41427 RepID=A0AAG5DVC6_ANOAO
MFSGCALLVTTAPTYRRLYEAMPEVLVRKRISIVVIDNIDQMQQHFGPDLQLLLKNCDKPELQIIITAGSWNQALGVALSRYQNMATCIGAYLEAALYAKVQFQLRLLRNDGSKQRELVQYIRERNYRTQRTIVFGSTTEELDRIVETLRQHSIQHVVCGASTIVNQHAGFRYWDELVSGEMEVLVCLDELVSDLCVSKAQHIVHYSLPDSWARFTRRFAASFNYDVLPYQKRNSDESPKARPTTLVLVDENSTQQLPKLIYFLKLHNVQLPEKLSVLAPNIPNAIEHERVINGGAPSALCPKLLAVANCRNIRSCAYRHTFLESDLDFGDSLPARGTVVRLHILHVFSPVHFVASLDAHGVGYAASSSTPRLNRKEFLLYDFKLQAYFANAERHQTYGKQLKPNGLCALLHEHNYWRCRIVHFEAEEGESATVGNVQLKLIDTGRIVTAKSTDLLVLPAQFQALPSQAIDVRIAGVVPLDWEEDWDQDSTKHVQGWIADHAQQSNHYLEGTVLLALRDTIWIEELVLAEQLDGMPTAVVSTKIKSSIVSKKFGVYDRGSFERIKQNVQNVEAARTVDVPVEEKRLAKIQPPATSQQPEDKSNTSNDQHELAVERSLDSSAGTSKQEDVVRDPIPVPTCSRHQASFEGEHSKANNMSIPSTSALELSPPTPGKEKYRFAALENGTQYNVLIGQYFSPDLFYVYQIDTMIQIHQNIKTYVESSSKTEQLTHFEVGVFCLSFFEDTYRRSQIVEVTEEAIKVFLLDVGGTIWCYRETLFEIPTHLLRDVPFAAIEAKLGLIEPLEGSTWTEQIGNAIYDDVLGKYNDCGMVAQVLKTLEPRHEAGAADLSVEGCHRYELLLTNYDATHAFSIISELAQNQLVMVDYKHQDIASDAEDDEDASIMDFSHALLNTNEQSVAVPGAAAATAAIEETKASPVGTECSSSHQLSKENSTDTSKSSNAAGHEPAKSTATANLPQLQCDFRIPQTEWWQADGIITLYVHAPDVVDYRLVVNMRSVLLQFYRDDQPYALALNLFGPIDPKYTIHEVRGLSIVIRLIRLPGSTWRWPYLLNVNVKVPYLKRVSPPRHRYTSSDERSGSESSDDEEVEWPDFLLTRQEDMQDFCSDSSIEIEDDILEDEPEYATED